MEKILSPKSTIQEIDDTLHEMGLIAKDRYIGLNHQFKRVMQFDIPDPLSQESLRAAQRLGINIPYTESSLGYISGATPEQISPNQGGTVTMIAPDGTERDIPESLVEEAIRKGARRK